MGKKNSLIKAFVLSILICGLGSFWGTNTVNAQTNLLDLESIDTTNIIENGSSEDYLTVAEVEVWQAIMQRPDYLDLEAEQFEQIFNEMMASKIMSRSGSSTGLVGGTKELVACKLKYSVGQCNYALQTSQRANSETKKRFGYNGMDDKSDAFRHAYWNALMANGYGVSFAKTIADNHEKYNPGSTLANQMDTYNNEQGRTVRRFGNVCYSETDLSNAVYSLLKNGSLKYIKSNKLVWSNK